MCQYVKWEPSNDGLAGFSFDRRHLFSIVTKASRQVRLYREPNGGCEVLRTVRDAKEYGDNLARLWGFRQLQS